MECPLSGEAYVDTWPSLDEFTERIQEIGYNVAISNKCWEVWLTLHYDNFVCPNEFCDSHQIKTEYGRNYSSKNNIILMQPHEFIESVKQAISRAKKLESAKPKQCRCEINFQSDLIPNCPGTKVHLLVEDIFRFQKIRY